MATAARGVHAVRVYLEMIKIEHSIFALPFALLGMMWAAHGWPGWRTFLLIVLAMVSARSAAMAFNRIADRDIDAVNPRTRMRAIPAGLLQLREANLFFLISCAVFFVAAWALNPLALALSPVALGTILLYSVTKRFTPLCHFVLGLSLGIAPAAAWIGTSGALHPAILPVTFAVMFWTAGFDIIYSLQDEDFDREHGLRSLPQTLGKGRALAISRVCHVFAILLLALAGFLQGAGALYFAGVVVAGALLAYEQSLVRPDDLSKVNVAFFTLNGFVSIGVFLFALVDQAVRYP
jgi:4-hydroxybenzoate polyprenyltransferase